MPHPRNRSILALDPGLRDLGYAVLTPRRLLIAGVLPLRSVPRKQRVARVREAVRTWIRAYRPDTLVLEQIPKRALDQQAGLPALGRALQRLARRRRLKVASYSVKAVRRTVVGNGWAGKREVAAEMTAHYPELRVYRTQDRLWKEEYWHNLFDAAALGRHHLGQIKPPSRSR